MKAVERVRAHLAGWREWELNPIVVKELRQAVRSWAVTGMLLLFLAVLFCTALTLLVTQSFGFEGDQRVGATIFQVFTGILTGASLFFIPLYVGVRLAAERQDSNVDLLYITTLTPGRIIRGKFLGGAYMTILFFSACMPFMAFTNLLRGIDLPTVAFILACLFAVVCVAIQLAIFCACLPISKLFKVLIALLGLGCIAPVIAWLTFIFYSMMQSGVGSMMARSEFWVACFVTGGIGLAVTALLYLLSVALISPPSANRALALRGYLTGVWIAGAGAALYWVFDQNNARLIVGWAIPSLIVLALSLVVVVSNADQLSLRVRRDIPEAAGKRALALLFYNGAAGGLVWIALLAGGTLLLTCWLLNAAAGWGPHFQSLDAGMLDEFADSILGSVLYAMAYALTALFVHRRFLPRRSPKLAGIFLLLIPAALALIPNIGLFFANRLSLREMEATQLGNVFNIYLVNNPGQRIAHLLCAAAWVVAGVVLNAGWFARQWRAFRPLDKCAPPPPGVADSVPPALPTGQASS